MPTVLGHYYLADKPASFDWIKGTTDHFDLNAWDGVSPIALTLHNPDWEGISGVSVRPPGTASSLAALVDPIDAPIVGRIESVQLVTQQLTGPPGGTDVFLLGTVPEPACVSLVIVAAFVLAMFRRVTPKRTA